MITNVEIGIDFGSKRVVIGTTKGKSLDILINEGSFRLTQNLVSYTNNERFLGDPAQSKLKSNYKNTINYFSRLLNINYNSDEFKLESKFLYAKTKADDNGKVLFIVNNKGKEEYFYPEQALGTMFSKINEILAFNNIKTTNITVSVPDYLSVFERKLFENAANMGGFKKVSLINESYAASLQYGFYKKVDFKDNSRNVMFLDFGHSKTSMYLVKFSGKEASIINKAYDKNCGCRDIDFILLNKCVEEFKKSTGIDISNNKKAQIRLLEVILKQRAILSANQEVNIIVECLDEDEDFNYVLTREEFNEISSPIFEKIEFLLNKFKSEIEIDFKDIHSIELLGGGSRIPLFQTLVNKFFEGVLILKSMDATETIALGTTLKGALDSPLKAASKYVIKDLLLNQINLTPILNGEKKDTITLFKYQSLTPKILGYNSDPLKEVNIKISYDDQYLKESDQKNLIEIDMKPVKFEGENSMIKTNFKLDEFGYITVDKIFLNEKIKKLVEKKKEEKDEKKENDEEKMKEEKDEEPEYKTVERSTDITNKAKITYFYVTNKDRVNQFIDYENQLNYEDKKVFDFYKIKNQFESSIYETRSKLDSDFKKLYNPSEYNNYINILNQNETWFYDGGLNASYDDFKNKIDELNKVVGFIYDRFRKVNDVSLLLIKLNKDFVVLNQHITDAKLEGNEINVVNENINSINQLKTEIEVFLNTYDFNNIDNFNLTMVRDNLNKCFDNVTNHIKEINRERKKKLEEERKKKEEEEKKKKEEEKMKKEEEEKKKKEDDSKMKEENVDEEKMKEETIDENKMKEE